MESSSSRFVVMAALVFGALSAVAESGNLSSPTAVLQEIKADGAKAVLGRLWADQSKFEAMCNEIEKGKAEWLEIARELRLASDAAVTLSLNYSVARALPVVPNRVLGLTTRVSRCLHPD